MKQDTAYKAEEEHSDKMYRWISVKDRLPHRGESVLFIVKSYHDQPIRYGWFDGENWMEVAGLGWLVHVDVVTYWMELPIALPDDWDK